MNTMLYQNIREEELKNKVVQDFFALSKLYKYIITEIFKNNIYQYIV
jgi:hypothetical protein